MKKNLLNQFKNKKVLITGGTGSFGSTFVKYLLKYTSPKQILIYSRDEMKQWMLKEELKKYNKINYIIGDVRYAERTHNVFRGVDYVVHAAATKIVPTAERNPEECIKTNVLGGMNVINASIANKVKKAITFLKVKNWMPIPVSVSISVSTSVSESTPKKLSTNSSAKIVEPVNAVIQKVSSKLDNPKKNSFIYYFLSFSFV